ncbi:DNA (cytosine-5)-methyltransferase PliMCI-like [Diorhabda carinulata]|uniref:DNA (cytosine-5)-methyltransferase PliMCI-like n=1 Tax=Diorhabda carinulata TaxID=1163345 RepID=UPI00259FFF37|nr:DNA (cytosine-5)-methyltransferase PliMCI-like [Diorhabda carinulata]
MPNNENCNANKKIKTENNSAKIIKNNNKLVMKSERCIVCKQFSDSVLYYGGHPNYSNDEFIALTDEKLSLYTGKEQLYNDDDIPTHKITYFTVYDKMGHLCSFDCGLIEKNVSLYFSGYIKPIYEEDSSPDNGVPAHDLGPIDEWWMAGFDGGENLPIGFTTQFAHYYLMSPSKEYESIFSNIKEKVKMAKYVTEYVYDHAYENPTYEDLVENIKGSGEFKDVEDLLLQNAQFICDQVTGIDETAEEDDLQLITLPCIRSLIQIAGVAFRKRRKVRIINKISKTKHTMTKAVTTKLVQDVFEQFFPDQINSNVENKGPKKKRCGVCEPCQSPDCGECNHCKDMLKFGGSGRAKQACKRRRCMQMAIIDAEISENEEENDVEDEQKHQKVKHLSKKIIHRVEWKDKAERKYKGYDCYRSAEIDNFTVQAGDYVMLRSENPKDPLAIAKIVYMYDEFLKKFHGQLMYRGTDTILGETADPRELFVVDECEDLLLGSVLRKANVIYRKVPEDWSIIGGNLNLEEPLEDNGKDFFFSKRFETNRFVDIVFDSEHNSDGCESCRRRQKLNEINTPTLVANCISWRNESYTIGTGVFLHPDVYIFEYIHKRSNENNGDICDLDSAELYPEYYRKNFEKVKGSNENTPNPFVIGSIEDIFDSKNDINIKVRIFFRPENTFGMLSSAFTKDINYLYYSDEMITVSFDKVMGRCYLAYGYNFASSTEWSEQGPYRFYFLEAYDAKKRKIFDLPAKAKNIGIIGKGKGGGKIKGMAKQRMQFAELPTDWEKIERPLATMDVFAGCGGLSEGLKMSKIAESKWAIERDVAAANAFKQNNPSCRMFIEDCNDILSFILSGQAKDNGLPEKGEVEMLVGGPPCQGFSGMNRFNYRNYSSFKNSLVVSYLTFCEYYRPKYFILENVKNFVSFKKSMVLKLTLRCLLAMGYQVTFGILQAGQYGIPQTRRRLILMASAPGYVLPKYPEPQHVFNKKVTHLSFSVDGDIYYNECFWTESAPYRTITVKDAMSDLPSIKNGCSNVEMAYNCEPETHFQRKMRGVADSGLLRDHICKEMSTLVEARMSHIPTYPGSDWRDLPNISLKLSDGTSTVKLKYLYRTKKQKPEDSPRGVCQCVTGKPCDPADKQSNTLIPWCLPHTGDRHNHWAGLYGRLEWDGYFGTTITNPEPMGKQGRVLHPNQHRVVSVRECARSQGFRDTFKFCGSILDKYRQVGNAVPPPLGAAIGREIAKAFQLTMDKHPPELPKQPLTPPVQPATPSENGQFIQSSSTSPFTPAKPPKIEDCDLTINNSFPLL